MRLGDLLGVYSATVLRVKGHTTTPQPGYLQKTNCAIGIIREI